MKRKVEELGEIERLKPILEKVRVEDSVKGIREDRKVDEVPFDPLRYRW